MMMKKVRARSLAVVPALESVLLLPLSLSLHLLSSYPLPRSTDVAMRALQYLHHAGVTYVTSARVDRFSPSCAVWHFERCPFCVVAPLCQIDTRGLPCVLHIYPMLDRPRRRGGVSSLSLPSSTFRVSHPKPTHPLTHVTSRSFVLLSRCACPTVHVHVCVRRVSMMSRSAIELV